MIRQAAAVVVVLLLSPSWVTAQGTELTVNVASASVHKSPTNTSPTLGIVGRGARLEVTREVGDWVKVAYPAAADGVGYVRRAWVRWHRRRLQGRSRAPRRARTRSQRNRRRAWRHRRRPSKPRPEIACRCGQRHRSAVPRATCSGWARTSAAHVRHRRQRPRMGAGRFGLQFELSRYGSRVQSISER